MTEKRNNRRGDRTFAKSKPKMSNSTSFSDTSECDSGNKEPPNENAASNEASTGGLRSPIQRKADRTKSTKAKTKTPVTKNPKKLAPLPSRALNAYNIFFREERKRWIDQRNGARQGDVTESTTASAFPPFAQMGKIIGQKWKELPANEKLKFESLAKEDMQRYRKEVDDYKSKLIQETEKSAETLGKDTVSSAWNYRSSYSEDDAEVDSKPEASSRPQLILPSTNGSTVAPTLLQGNYPFETGYLSSSQINSQTHMHDLLHHVLHASQDANILAYAQQQQHQQQMLSTLLPRMTLQQSQEMQQQLARQQQLQNNHQELLLLNLAGSYSPHAATAVASALGSSLQLPHLSLDLLNSGFPGARQLLQSQPWQLAVQRPSSFSADLDIQLRISAFLRQQHLMQLAQQSDEDVGKKSPPRPPSRG